MRAAPTDGIFIHARSLTNLVGIDTKVARAVYSFANVLPTIGRLLHVGAAKNQNMNKLGMKCLIYSTVLLIYA